MPDINILLASVVATIIVLVLVGNWIKDRRARQRFAQLTNLSRTKLGWRSEEYAGKYRNWPLTLNILAVRTSSMSQSTLTLVVKNTAIRSFSLAEDPFYKDSESFGASVFRSNEEYFDNRFTFKAHSPQVANAFLSRAGLRQKLLGLRSVEIQLIGERLSYVCQGDVSEFDIDEAVSILGVLCDMAAIVETLPKINEEKDVARR